MHTGTQAHTHVNIYSHTGRSLCLWQQEEINIVFTMPILGQYFCLLSKKIKIHQAILAASILLYCAFSCSK